MIGILFDIRLKKLNWEKQDGKSMRYLNFARKLKKRFTNSSYWEYINSGSCKV